MSEQSGQFIKSPLELAQRYAEELALSGALDGYDPTDIELERLAELDQYAEMAGNLNQPHFVTSGRSILLPTAVEPGEPVSTTHFEALSFSGDLVTHSVVRIGRRLGGQSMRAICLTFDNVLLLPYFDEIPEGQLLYVPALAIQDMDRLSA